ncbi:MAG TPA: hypothetical protein VMG30_11220 [Acidobacteriota bacterium]|nr:hypothetical protein [Acidobacteriota bacterium]
MKGLSLSVLAVLLLATVYCFAVIPIGTADITFSFIAGGKTYPAGNYRFFVNDAESELTIQGMKETKASGIVPVLTRLAAREQNDVSFVFDVAGNDHYLSEIHIPNMDGFYFKSAPAKHTHVTVRAAKGK